MVNCFECNFNQVCCSLGVTLSNKEIKKYKRKKFVPLTENNLILGHVFALEKDNIDGFCVYFDRNTRLCKIYDNRPCACKQYDCTGIL